MYDSQTNVTEGGQGEIGEEENCQPEVIGKSSGGAPIDATTEKFIAYIYILTDEFGVIRYVGKTNHPDQRLQYHCYVNRRSHKDNWIKSMLKNGHKPVMEIIDEIECERDSDWHEAERFWIAYFRFLGFPLTNLESGGQGPGKIAAETRAKMSEARKGKPTGIPMSPDLKAKLLSIRLGSHHSEDTKKKISNTNKKTGAIERLKGFLPPAGWNKGVPSSEETKAKQSASHIARGTGKGPKSQEHKKKLSEANKGKKHPEETLAKMRGPRGPNIRTLRKLGLAPPKDQSPPQP